MIYFWEEEGESGVGIVKARFYCLRGFKGFILNIPLLEYFGCAVKVVCCMRRMESEQLPKKYTTCQVQKFPKGNSGSEIQNDAADHTELTCQVWLFEGC